jgi:alanine racemase
MRPIKATISQSALQHNLAIVKNHTPQSRIMAVVKANGYGHGLMNVVHGLSDADGFAVLGINEAIDLREAGFEQTILLLEGAFSVFELDIAAGFGFDVVVHSAPQVDMLELAKLKKPVNVHLKMNSGMNRLGFTPLEFSTAFQRLSQCKNVRSIVLMTHFATADDDRGIQKQLDVFKSSIADFPKVSAHLVSLANSATILRYPQAHADWVRPGIMLYGASPVEGALATQFNLKPVMTLSSEVIGVQTLQAGQSVGYGHLFTANKTTRVGIVACGYADGYPRHAPNGTPINVAGQLTQTLGRVSMDMLFVDLTDAPEANIGAPVELWGNHVSVDAVASAADTIGYELLCAVAPRVPAKIVD